MIPIKAQVQILNILAKERMDKTSSCILAGLNHHQGKVYLFTALIGQNHEWFVRLQPIFHTDTDGNFNPIHVINNNTSVAENIY